MEKQWSLESFDTDGKHVVFVITQLPCRIGRGKESDLHISNLGLSRAHAVLIRDISGQLRLIDENSTNGTFVNRHRVDGYCLLNENDIIHFASAEFKLRLRLVEQNTALPFDEMHTMLMPDNTALSEHFVPNEAEFDELIMATGCRARRNRSSMLSAVRSSAMSCSGARSIRCCRIRRLNFFAWRR